MIKLNILKLLNKSGLDEHIYFRLSYDNSKLLKISESKKTEIYYDHEDKQYKTYKEMEDLYNGTFKGSENCHENFIAWLDQFKKLDGLLVDLDEF